MKEKILKWVEKNKKQETAFVNLLKFLYLISFDWLNTVLDILLTLLLTYYFEEKKWLLFGIIITSIILITIWYSMVNFYKNYKKQIDEHNKLILDEINLITTTLDNYINNENNVEGIFEFASDLVSASIYNTLPKFINCEIRVSIIQQFRQKSKNSCVMLSRNSKTRQKSKKTQKNVKYEKNKDYYYLKILVDNKDSMIIFNEEQIDKHFFYKNKDRKSDIKQYLCIPDKHQTDEIIFLLQLDAMKENVFGKDREEINNFYNNYIYPYICFLRHAYNIERNLKKKEGVKDE